MTWLKFKVHVASWCNIQNVKCESVVATLAPPTCYAQQVFLYPSRDRYHLSVSPANITLLSTFSPLSLHYLSPSSSVATERNFIIWGIQLVNNLIKKRFMYLYRMRWREKERDRMSPFMVVLFLGYGGGGGGGVCDCIQYADCIRSHAIFFFWISFSRSYLFLYFHFLSLSRALPLSSPLFPSLSHPIPLYD